MCAREGPGRGGYWGQKGKKVEESWKLVLFQEMAQIGREQTTECGRWPFMSFMLQQLLATSTNRAGPSSAGLWDTPHCNSSLLTDNIHFPQLPILNPCEPLHYSSRLCSLSMELAKIWHHRTAGGKDISISSPKYTSLSLIIAKKNQSGSLKHFQLFCQGENTHRNDSIIRK